MGKKLFKESDAPRIQKQIDDYFDSLKGHPILNSDGTAMVNKRGEPVFVPDKPPTSAGLCRALGFKSRQTLLNYRKKEGKIKDVLDGAMLRIEEYTETRLFDRDGFGGARFSLTNNFGWVEKPEQSVENNVGVVILGEIEEVKTNE